MAQTFMTLEYLGAETALADLGVDMESVTGEFMSMAPDVFSFAIAGDITADPLWPFEAVVKIRTGRTRTGGPGAWVYAGGALEFTGKRLAAVLDGRPEYNGVIYQFAGPAYDLQETPYQQVAMTYIGTPALGSYLVSDLVLFTRLGPLPFQISYINTGAQIRDILQHLLDQYAAQGMTAPYQIGTIDPATNVMTYQVKDIKCLEAIEMCLRCHPDCTMYFDYATSPPTVHVRARANLAAVTRAFGNGSDHKSFYLVPRPNLQARCVVLYFKQTNQVNNDSLTAVTKQKYPLDGPEGGLRVLVQTIDLQGYNQTHVTGTMKVSTPNPSWRGWWQRYVADLRSLRVRNFQVQDYTVLDLNGAPVSLAAYPNVLEADGGSICPWMTLPNGTPIVAVEAIISAHVSYDEYDRDAVGDPETATNGIRKDSFSYRVISTKVTLTNGVTGTYDALASSTDAEQIPVGMAQAVYQACAQLQYEGRDIRVATISPSDVRMGNVLNLSGGRAEWLNMNALVQRVSKRYGRGFAEVTVGPARHLGAGDLTQLFLINRFRRVMYNPLARATAKGGGGASAVALPNKMAQENTSDGLDQRALAAILADAGSGNRFVVVQDASNQQIKIQTVDGTNTPVGATKSMVAALGDLPSAAQAKFQKMYFKNPDDSCNRWSFYYLGTAAVSDP